MEVVGFGGELMFQTFEKQRGGGTVKKYVVSNWKITVIRVALFVGLFAFCIPGLSQATPDPVPEPNILLLLGTALVGLGFAGRKVRK